MGNLCLPECSFVFVYVVEDVTGIECDFQNGFVRLFHLFNGWTTSRGGLGKPLRIPIGLGLGNRGELKPSGLSWRGSFREPTAASRCSSLDEYRVTTVQHLSGLLQLIQGR